MFSHRVFREIGVYIVAAGCLVWVISGVRFDALFVQMRGMHLWWIPPAMILDVFTTVCHGFRWKLLVRPLATVTLLRTTQAIYTGLFTNEILPMKAGEFVRGYLLSRWLSLPLSSVLPSMITERAFDGSLLVLGLGLCAFFVSLPQRIVDAGLIVGVAMLLVIVVLVLLAFIETQSTTPSSRKKGTYHAKYASPHPADPATRWKSARRIMMFLSQLASGMRAIRTSVRFLAVLAASLLYIFSQVLSYWMVMKAYGLNLPFWAPAVVLIIARLGSAVPNAPANIGPYQFFCVIGLMLFDVEKTMATGLAIVLSLVFSIPIFILGSIAFVRSGLSVAEIRKGRRQTTFH